MVPKHDDDYLALTRAQMAMGAYVRRLREARGLTQEELGEEVGLDAGVISKIELGKTTLPQRRVLRFPPALSVDPVEFTKTYTAFLLPDVFVGMFPREPLPDGVSDTARALKLTRDRDKKNASKRESNARKRKPPKE